MSSVGEPRAVEERPPARRRSPSSIAVVMLVLLGVGIPVALGVYAEAHTPEGRPLATFGFSGMLQMKSWLTTAALVLVVVQVVTAAGMWGRLPGSAVAPPWVAVLHRWSGSIAFTLTLPVALHCLWAIGWSTSDTRVLVHSLVGCLFYGAYAAKMLGIRLPGLPGWTVPVLGGTVFTLMVLLWLTSSLWFFTRSGIPMV